MSGFLLDTNVVSEVRKQRANPRLLAWLGSRDERTLSISVVTLGELRQGIAMTGPDDGRRERLVAYLADLQARFAGRILPIGEAVAECWGTINGDARARGAGPLSVIDSLIAATAIHHQLTVVTRNTRHFLETGATVFDPFT